MATDRRPFTLKRLEKAAPNLRAIEPDVVAVLVSERLHGFELGRR
jgi:hypothetical protein